MSNMIDDDFSWNRRWNNKIKNRNTCHLDVIREEHRRWCQKKKKKKIYTETEMRRRRRKTIKNAMKQSWIRISKYNWSTIKKKFTVRLLLMSSADWGTRDFLACGTTITMMDTARTWEVTDSLSDFLPLSLSFSNLSSHQSSSSSSYITISP